MGQTLNHGVYLPAEGERNCYSGLASNWNLLDAALGDIDGKASATHTHGNLTNDGKVGTTANLPLITGTGGVVQAGSFGNTANTFCEGNDSRLSDARTPVAHTHTKSDVTNLLNSNFIPSANNSYNLGSSSYQWNNLYAKNYFYNGTAWGLDKGNTWTGDNTYTATINYQSSYTLGNPPQSATAQTAVMVTDLAGTNYLAQITTYQETTLSGLRFTIRDKFDSNGFSPSGNNRNKHFYFLQGTSNRGYLQWEGFVNNNIHPLETNTYNLGTTAYQWNNIYAKNYFYNGTQWGLDQANDWSAINSYSKGIKLQGGRTAYVLPESAASYSGLTLLTYNAYGAVKIGVFTESDSTPVLDTTKGYLSVTTGELNSANIVRLEPVHGDTAALGTSTNKWKSLNGVNPGALSLPDYNNILDVTSEVPIASLDGNTQIDINNYLPNKTGWLSIVIADTAGNFIVATQGRSGGSTSYNNSRTFHTGAQSNGYISVFFPILANMNKFVSIKASSLIQMRFYYCLGNV